jgi:hypothetical protein
LRWMDCDFVKEVFYIRHSYYWGRGGHLKATKTEASAKPLPMHPALKNALLEWKAGSLYAAETDFVFPSLRRKWAETTRPGCSAEPKNQARICEGRNFRHGLAYFSAFGRKHPGQHGRTPAHDPRLPAPQQPQRDEPILASDFEDQASRTRAAGRCDPAYGIAVREQVNSGSVNPARQSIAQLSSELRTPVLLKMERLMDPNGPRFSRRVFVCG